MNIQQIRLNRLRGEHQLLATLDRESDLIDVRAMSGNPPEVYRVTYRVAGITAIQTDGRPRLDYEHVMAITLPAGFPREAPTLYMQSPMYHPNIRASDGLVCIDQWFPNQRLDDLVIQIGEIIRYANYNPGSAHNGDAANWARAHSDLFPLDKRPWRRALPELEIIIEGSEPGPGAQRGRDELVIDIEPQGGGSPWGRRPLI